MCAHVLDIVCRYGAGVSPPPHTGAHCVGQVSSATVADSSALSLRVCVCARVYVSSSFLVKPVFLRLRFSSDAVSFSVVSPFLFVGGPSTCLKVNQ